jgi:hypothetical protein
MIQLTPRERDAIFRYDFPAFTQAAFFELEPNKIFEPSWHHEAIAQLLMESQGKKTRKYISGSAAVAEIFSGLGRMGRLQVRP